MVKNLKFSQIKITACKLFKTYFWDRKSFGIKCDLVE